MRVPYLDWIICNLSKYEYRSNYSYDLGEYVTVEGEIYKSLIRNNLNNNPLTSNNWLKIS